MKSRRYIYHPEKLERNVADIKKEFSFRLKNFELAYSFKTNRHNIVLADAKKLGLKAEVVSTEEYKAAMDSGWKESEIIYNGVCKEKELFVSTALSGGMANIDNEEELFWAEEYFDQKKNSLELGLRLCFDIGNGIKSRFGIEVGSEAYKRTKELSAQGKIKIIGLSCHFTKTRQKKFWIKKAEELARTAKGFPLLEYLDFGGSLAGGYEKTDPRKKTAGEEIDFASVAESIYETLEKFGLENKKIILECGTAIVGSAFDISSRVLHIKESGFIVLDVSFKDMMIPSLSDSVAFEIISGGGKQRMLNNFTITGCTCLENDIIKKGFNGKLAVGDRIIFRNVGAYTLCFSNGFIRDPLEVEVQ